MSSLSPSESSMQETIMEWCSWHPPLDEVVIHIANQRKCTKAYGGHLKKMGVKRGVSDLFVAMQAHGYPGMFVELKSEKGKLTGYQAGFLLSMKQQGYYVACCNNIDDTIKLLRWYAGIG
jgi:VRR-NUC domain